MVAVAIVKTARGVRSGMVPSTGRNRYRGVSRPGDGALGWVAQRKGHCYAARFESEKAAARWLARRLGVSVSSLRWEWRGRDSGGSNSCHISSHHGVVYHRGCWEARGPGSVVLGYFGTEQAAVARVMKDRKVKKKSLVKRDFSRRVLRSHFKVKHRIFGDYIPGDVQCMYEQESKNAHIYKQDGDVIVVMVMVMMMVMMVMMVTMMR